MQTGNSILSFEISAREFATRSPITIEIKLRETLIITDCAQLSC